MLLVIRCSSIFHSTLTAPFLLPFFFTCFLFLISPWISFSLPLSFSIYLYLSHFESPSLSLSFSLPLFPSLSAFFLCLYFHFSLYFSLTASLSLISLSLYPSLHPSFLLSFYTSYYLIFYTSPSLPSFLPSFSTSFPPSLLSFHFLPLLHPADKLAAEATGGDEIYKEMAATESLKGSSRHLIYMGRNEYKKCRNIPRLREFAELFSVPVCDFGDAIRHGFKAEPPPTPSLGTEEGKRSYVIYLAFFFPFLSQFDLLYFT